MTDRVEALEERVAHLMRAVDDLSDVVAARDAVIRRLEKQVALLLEREAAREAEGGVLLGDERPPHY